MLCWKKSDPVFSNDLFMIIIIMRDMRSGVYTWERIMTKLFNKRKGSISIENNDNKV